MTLGGLILTLVLLAVTYMLSLPGGNRHAPWCDVYSAIDIQRRKRFSRRQPCIRVGLNDGVVARLHVDEIDRQPFRADDRLPALRTQCKDGRCANAPEAAS